MDANDLKNIHTKTERLFDRINPAMDGIFGGMNKLSGNRIL